MVPKGLRCYPTAWAQSRGITRESRGNHGGITPPPEVLFWVRFGWESRPNHAQSRAITPNHAHQKHRNLVFFTVFWHFFIDFWTFFLFFGSFCSIFQGLGVKWFKFCWLPLHVELDEHLWGSLGAWCCFIRIIPSYSSLFFCNHQH